MKKAYTTEYVTREQVLKARHEAQKQSSQLPAGLTRIQVMQQQLLEPLRAVLHQRGYNSELQQSTTTNTTYLRIFLSDGEREFNIGRIRFSDHPPGGKRRVEFSCWQKRDFGIRWKRSAIMFAIRLNTILQAFPPFEGQKIQGRSFAPQERVCQLLMSPAGKEFLEKSGVRSIERLPRCYSVQMHSPYVSRWLGRTVYVSRCIEYTDAAWRYTWHCDCPLYKRRRACRHIEIVERLEALACNEEHNSCLGD